jgi:hypothetical protein
MDPDAPVPNPRLAALRRARRTVLPLTDALRADLDPARVAMDAGAWVSTAADTFYAELAEHVAALGRAADGSLDNLDAAIAGEPAMVDASRARLRPS